MPAARDVAVVALGGLVGAPARYGVSRLLPTRPESWPTGTFVVNLAGAFVLGLLLEGLLRAGPDEGRRRTLRLLLGTGFVGAFTTASTLAVETDELVRARCYGLAVAYPLVSLVAGLLLTVAGVALGGRGGLPGHGRPAEQRHPLPSDPDAS